MLAQSNLGSFGFPRIDQALGPRDLRDADLAPLIQARASVRKLRISVVATVVAVVTALAAAGILLFAGPALPLPTVKVTTTVGSLVSTTACGTLTYLPAPATTVDFKPDVRGGAPESIDLRTVTAITAC